MKLWLLRAMYAFSLALAIAAGCLFIVTEVRDGFRRRWFADRQWPLGKVGGVIVSNDAVFVGAWYDGRVYKFGFDGRVLDWFDNHGAPIWIHQLGDSIVIHYSGRAWQLERPGFKVLSPPQGTSGEVLRTWYGHPLLRVRRPEGTTIVSLQPWHMTLFQHPYPAGMLVPLSLVLFFAARWASQKRKRLAGHVPTTPQPK